jgi:branched-chain amino acid transport system substrate-binding protein
MHDRNCRPRTVTLAVVSIALMATGCTSEYSADRNSRIVIGLVASLTGAYRAIGEDMRDGFSLYLNARGGSLGGHPVDLVVVDESDASPDALSVVARTLDSRDVLAVAGVTNAQTVLSLLPTLRAKKAPLISSNGFPGLDDVQAVWSTSFLPDEPGRALAAYLRAEADGPVWTMAVDDQGGRANVAGFVDAFVSGGGALSNVGRTPLFTGTTNFLPYLTQAKASGAKAVYAFYVGAEATSFVQQYAQSDARDLPLFGTGVLTEGRVLAAQGRAAVGVRTVLNYAPDLDNPSNRRFVDEWRAAHNSLPTTYAMASWDAAHLLDKAIAAAGSNPSPTAVNVAIASIGLIDSPRGEWQFSAQHSPVQRWYLRRVQTDGRTLTNSLIQDLDILGAEGASP